LVSEKHKVPTSGLPELLTQDFIYSVIRWKQATRNCKHTSKAKTNCSNENKKEAPDAID